MVLLLLRGFSPSTPLILKVVWQSSLNILTVASTSGPKEHFALSIIRRGEHLSLANIYMKNFDRKVILITGAGSGIGRALALQLASEGAELVLNDISHERLTETARAVRKFGASCCCYVADISDADEVNEFADVVSAEYHRVDILINNAGVALGRLDFEEISLKDWKWIVNVNFWGMVNVTRSFLPHLKKAQRGHMVNLSSIYGYVSARQRAAYCASKAAVRSLSETLRQELRGQGIEVTTVLPGLVSTNITQDGRGWKCSKEQKRAAWVTANRAPTKPEEAARQIIRGIKARRRKVIIGLDARLVDILASLLPGYYHRIVNFFAVHMEKRLGRGMRENASADRLETKKEVPS